MDQNPKAATIRSGFPVEGPRLFVEEMDNGVFEVASRWQRFHKTDNLDEALVVFEGLCLEINPGRTHARNLVHEARRLRKSRFAIPAQWERRVIECARRRSEGLVPVICGSKGALEHWVPAESRPQRKCSA